MSWFNPNDEDYFLQRVEDWFYNLGDNAASAWNSAKDFFERQKEQLAADWHGMTTGSYEKQQEAANADPVLGVVRTIRNSLTGERNRENEYYSNKLAEADFKRSMSAAQQAHDWDVENMKMQQDYETAMANSSYQRGVADMQAAGLNPLLAYSQGGASTPSVSAVSSSQAQSHAGQVDTRDYLRDMLQFAVQTASVVAGLSSSLSRTATIADNAAINAAVSRANNSASNSAKMAAASAAAASRIGVEEFRKANDHIGYRRWQRS